MKPILLSNLGIRRPTAPRTPHLLLPFLLLAALQAVACFDSGDPPRDSASDSGVAGEGTGAEAWSDAARGNAAGTASGQPGPGRLLVVSGASDEIVVLDAGDGARRGSISLDIRPGEVDEPHGIAVDPKGDVWYATVAHGEATFWKFDARDDRRIGRLRLGSTGAARIGLTADGERAFIPSYWRGDSRPGTVAVVRLRDLTVLATPPVCAAPHHAAASPDGELVLVTCALGDEVVLLDADSLTVRARVSVAGDPEDEPTAGRRNEASTGSGYEARSRPMNATWSSNGEAVWVTLQASGEVIGLERTGAVFARIGVGTAPLQIAVGPDDRHAVVPLRGDTAVAILDLERRAVARHVALPGAVHPHGVVLSSSGDRAWISFEGAVGSAGGVVAVTVPEGRILWNRPVGSYVLGIAHVP